MNLLVIGGTFVVKAVATPLNHIHEILLLFTTQSADKSPTPLAL
jgi:hypothetical protein